MELNKPMSFNPSNSNNVVIKNEKRLQSIINTMQEIGFTTNEITIFDFYSKIEFLENKYKNLKKNGSNKSV